MSVLLAASEGGHESAEVNQRGSMSLLGLSPSFAVVGDEMTYTRGKSEELSAFLSKSVRMEVDFNEDCPAFTVKAVIAGFVAGVACTFLALYYGLKTGITPSLNILGGVLGYGVTRVIMKTGLFGTKFTPQENAVIQTLAVSIYTVACPSFGFTMGWLGLSKEAYIALGPTYPGNKLSDTLDLTYARSLVWTLALFSFGFFIAYPLRNYYVLTKKLFFPSGTATAYVVAALHTSRESASLGLSVIAKFAGLAYLVNMFTFTFGGLSNFPIFGLAAAAQSWTFDFDLGQFGIGMLLGIPVNASMLLGAIIIYGGLRPWIAEYRDGTFPGAWLDTAALNGNDYVGLFAYGLFSGLAVMIVQGVWSVAEIAITIIRSWNPGEAEEETDDPVERKRIEIFSHKGFPLWGSIVGYCLSGAVCVMILQFVLDTPWYQTILALLVVPPLACSNIEGLGRTDWDLASSYGKLMMFPIGAWNRHKKIIPCVALCHTTISGCSNSAMLMQDFKTGYLLGAKPSTMFLAQVIGTLMGCFVCPALFNLLRSAFVIPSANPMAFIPGRYGIVYRSLAIVATGSGFDALPKHTLDFAFFFGGVAIVLNTICLITEFWAPRATKYIPNSSALSIGMLVGACVPMEFLIGSVIAWWWAQHQPARAEAEKNYVASGLLAGSGMAVVLQCLGSVASFHSPIVVSFDIDPDSHVKVGQIVLATVFLLISAGMAWLVAVNYYKARSNNLVLGGSQPHSSPQYAMIAREQSLLEDGSGASTHHDRV